MAIDPDPYRTLGLARGASIDEIKRAYRRLAKIHHPDAAGEKNVPRFLAIQAAYEQLAGGADGRSSPGRASGPQKAWEADPDRSNATRRAYGGRGRWSTPGSTGGGAGSSPSGAASPGSGGSPGSAAGASSGRSSGSSSGGSAASGTDPRSKAGPKARPGPTRSGRRGMGGSGTAAGSGTSAGAGAGGATAGSGTDAGASGTPPRGRERKRNKATLGSTSYDGVEGPFEPDWRGASWYGTTSGTYWTLNPKEYADPRKHGPEYQARARRATRPSGGEAPTAADPTTGTDAAPGRSDDPEPGDTDARPTDGPTHTTSSWWESTTGATGPDPEAAATDPMPGASQRSADIAAKPEPPPDVGRALSDIGRALTDPTFGGGRGRLGRAFLGWLPIAFGVSWLVGEITGCGRFAATCTGLADPLVLALQVGALLVLLALPVVASVAAMGAITLLGAAVAAAFALSATGEAADSESRRVALGAVLLVSWLTGIGVAVARRVGASVSTTRPVS